MLNGQLVGSLLPEFSVAAVNGAVVTAVGFDRAEGDRRSKGSRMQGNGKLQVDLLGNQKRKFYFTHMTAL